MTILPGLTSTKKERIPEFLEDLRLSEIRLIALFPTMLAADERRVLAVRWSRYRGSGSPMYTCAPTAESMR